MTPTSGRFIGSSIAGLIVVARGRDYCTSSSGKASTTPLMQRVGNHLNTSPTHPTLSRHSIKPIQTSRPLKFMRRGPCYIHSLILSHSNDYFFLRTMFLESRLFFSFIYIEAQMYILNRTPRPPPSSPSPSLCPPPPIPRSTPPSSRPAASASLQPSPPMLPGLPAEPLVGHLVVGPHSEEGCACGP